MAKYYVKRACGHETQEQIIGPYVERDRKMAWLAEQDCPACYKAKREAKADAATAGMDLPHLSGTVRQVQWANTLRGVVIANARDITARMLEHGTLKPEYAVYLPTACNDLIALYASQITAQWFIDRHNTKLIPDAIEHTLRFETSQLYKQAQIAD